MRDFLVGLTTAGEVTVDAFVPAAAAPGLAGDEVALAALREWDELARSELAGDVPPLDVPAAGWALGQFYRASQLLVCRNIAAEAVTATLTEKFPAARGPATDFSVDLVFRFLPDLHDRARRIAPGDALVAGLEAWAREWPLSSPGIPLAEPPMIDSFAGCAALWRLYVDRIASRSAGDRWRDPRVAHQLRADLGAWPGLAPAIARALEAAPQLSA